MVPQFIIVGNIFANSIHFLACQIGFYGSNCTQVCSDKCVERLCDNTNGVCTHGCLDGWKDDLCNQGITFQKGINIMFYQYAHLFHNILSLEIVNGIMHLIVIALTANLLSNEHDCKQTLLDRLLVCLVVWYFKTN